MQVVWLVPIPVPVVLSTVYLMYFYKTTSLTSPGILLKIHFQYSIKSNYWLPVEETSTGKYHDNYVALVRETN